MAVEIERKFLVTGTDYRSGVRSFFRQGYLSDTPGRTVRVRVVDQKAFLTVKGLSKGASRAEYEYEIPLDDAREMLDNLCPDSVIEKYRYVLPAGNGLQWEVDEFLGANLGLVVAEIELRHENDSFQLPGWIGSEVTGDRRYYNSYLSTHPFRSWDTLSPK
ncbi:MAG: CYTH domain-containing protein [Paludibacteraceae bacterium]|nr:CYTH domain-containing protein [Paludibacteraceae bacterium]